VAAFVLLLVTGSYGEDEAVQPPLSSYRSLATRLLERARVAIHEGDLSEARKLLFAADRLDVSWNPGDDTPQKVLQTVLKREVVASALSNFDDDAPLETIQISNTMSGALKPETQAWNSVLPTAGWTPIELKSGFSSGTEERISQPRKTSNQHPIEVNPLRLTESERGEPLSGVGLEGRAQAGHINFRPSHRPLLKGRPEQLQRAISSRVSDVSSNNSLISTTLQDIIRNRPESVMVVFMSIPPDTPIDSNRNRTVNESTLGVQAGSEEVPRLHEPASDEPASDEPASDEPASDSALSAGDQADTSPGFLFFAIPLFLAVALIYVYRNLIRSVPVYMRKLSKNWIRPVVPDSKDPEQVDTDTQELRSFVADALAYNKGLKNTLA